MEGHAKSGDELAAEDAAGLANELWRWKMECKHASCKDPSC
jgi:hypothetical protein